MIKDIIIENPNGKGIACASDFGMHEKNSDNFEALTKAISYCKENNIGTLSIKKGVYKFTTPKSIEITSFVDFIIDGNGSEFVFSNTVHYFILKDCLRTQVTNLFIDWDWEKSRLGTLGKAVNVKNDEYFDLEFFEVPELSDGVFFGSMVEYDKKTLTPGTEDGIEVWLANLKYEKLSDNLFRFYGKTAINTGSIFMARHYLYGTQAFIVSDSKHIKLSNIVIYSVPGMAFHIEGYSEYIGICDCKIMLKPNEKRRVSATADGVHVCQSLGHILVEGCDFSFMGDDCINIHDVNTITLENPAKNTAICRRTADISAGDKLEFRNMDLSPVSFSAIAKKVNFSDGFDAASNDINNRQEVIFDCEIPVGNYILFNRNYDSGNYIFRNNYFHENRARGILVHNDNGLIENNRFYKNQGAAIQMETGAQFKGWSEGTCIDNVVIRGNVFDNCDVNDWKKGVIYIAPYLPDGETSYHAFRNIKIYENEFINIPDRIIIITSAENVSFENNVIKNPDSRRKNNATRSTIFVKNSENISVKGNISEKSPYCQPLEEIYI